MVNKNTYAKLAKKKGNFSLTSLHMGETHLLYVRHESIAESYKRFYYDEICALITVKTAVGLWLNIILGVGACSLAVVALINWNSPIGSGPSIAAGISALILFGLLLHFTLQGATCQTVIQTAVNREVISCLDRIKKTEAILRLIGERITQVQGPMGTVESSAADTTLAPPPAAPPLNADDIDPEEWANQTPPDRL